MITQILRLKDILYIARKHLSMIIGMTLAGLLVGILFDVAQNVSASNQTQYKVFVSISLDPVSVSRQYGNGRDYPSKDDFTLASTLVDSIAYIARSEKVCKTAVERLNLIGVTTNTVQKALTLAQYGETPIIELTLNWKDPNEGIEIMQTILDILPGAMREVLNLGNINIIEHPIVTTLSTPTSSKTVLIFSALGLLGSIAYCFVQMYIHPTLIDIKDVGELFNINTLSVIDEDPAFEQYLQENLITNRDNLSASMKEDYTALAHILLHQVEDEYFSFFVTSSARGEGKTTVVANLGIALAALDKRVLLIDFDLLSPTLGAFFTDNIDYKKTINAVYFDDTSVSDAVIQVSRNLYILMAVLDKRHIGIDHFAKKLIQKMETEFDIVILDTPSLGESADTLYFNTVSRNVLYVMRYDYAGCDVIAENLEKLNKTGTSILGAIVNRVPQSMAQASLAAKAVDEDEENGAFRSIRNKIPFLKKKKSNPHRAGKQTVRAENMDEFDSDDDLIDPKDYQFYTSPLAAGHGETRAAAARKQVGNFSDDNDDERIAYVYAAEMSLSREKQEEAEGETPADGGPEASGEAAQAGMEKEPAREQGGRLFLRRKKKKEKQDAAPAPISDEPEPAQSPADIQPPDAEEDEDARIARLLGAKVNHYHDDAQ